MAWKETDLLADLATRFAHVNPSATILQAEDAMGVTWLQVNVLEAGLTEQSRIPSAYRKNVEYYVFHRGQADENAWHSHTEPDNTSAGDVTAAVSTNLAVYKIYSSPVLRQRVQGQITKTIQAVLFEGAVPDHASRVKLAWSAMQLPDPILNVFMRFVALDATVQAGGATVADATLETVVNSWWTNVALSAGY